MGDQPSGLAYATISCTTAATSFEARSSARRSLVEDDDLAGLAVDARGHQLRGRHDDRVALFGVDGLAGG
jgi:hypothetical protein